MKRVVIKLELGTLTITQLNSRDVEIVVNDGQSELWIIANKGNLREIIYQLSKLIEVV